MILIALIWILHCGIAALGTYDPLRNIFRTKLYSNANIIPFGARMMLSSVIFPISYDTFLPATTTIQNGIPGSKKLLQWWQGPAKTFCDIFIWKFYDRMSKSGYTTYAFWSNHSQNNLVGFINQKITLQWNENPPISKHIITFHHHTGTSFELIYFLHNVVLFLEAPCMKMENTRV